jgi:hypothetical protein
MAKPILTLKKVTGADKIFRMPRIVAFNRLESRPRTRNFERSLQAAVHDPLWMLTRQWQFGEFQGEDAASPVSARVNYQHWPNDRIALRDQDAQLFDATAIPLETRIERERIPLTVRELPDGTVFSDVLFAIQWGRRFLKLLRARSLDGRYPLYAAKYPLNVLPATASPESDPEAEQLRMTVEGSVADGVALWRAVQDDKHDAWLDSVPNPDTAALKLAAADFAAECTAIFNRLFTQPADAKDSAWRGDHLEYQCATGAAPNTPGAPVLAADQFHGGRLDWSSFDVVPDRALPLQPEVATPAVPEKVESFLPAPVKFKGQPQPRFWQMEETQTDFGKIETSTTGLLHMLLAEFGLIYSNDWFMLPHPMPINTVCEVRGILVDDTFGRHTLIRPAGRAPQTQWQRWAMFHMTERGREQPQTNRFYLVPAIGKVLESPPLERVNFIRDEMSNMAWAIERIVASQTGTGMGGTETVKNREQPPNPSAQPDVKIQYVLGTTVPRNWIPFIPVHADDEMREIKLQRARMAGGEPPRSWLLREPHSPYFVAEEEVPRAGIYVESSWQRARWLGGRTFIWVGRCKNAGRGEGNSALAFDRILDMQAP